MLGELKLESRGIMNNLESMPFELIRRLSIKDPDVQQTVKVATDVLHLELSGVTQHLTVTDSTTPEVVVIVTTS